MKRTAYQLTLESMLCDIPIQEIYKQVFSWDDDFQLFKKLE